MAAWISSMVMPATRTRPIGRAEVDRAFGLDEVIAAVGRRATVGVGRSDRELGQGAHDLDLEDVVDFGPIGRQGDQFGDLDLQDVGRLDPVGGQRDERLLPRRFHLGRRGIDERPILLQVDRLAAGQSEADACEQCQQRNPRGEGGHERSIPRR